MTHSGAERRREKRQYHPTKTFLVWLAMRNSRADEARQAQQQVKAIAKKDLSPGPGAPFGSLTDSAWWDWYEYEIRRAEIDTLLAGSPAAEKSVRPRHLSTQPTN